MTTHKVFPIEQAPGQVFNASLADELGPKTWTKLVLFFSIGKPYAFEQASEDLVEGLRRVLGEVPALAGRVIRNGKGGVRDISIAIDDDPFVEFTSRDATKSKSTPSYDEFEQRGFPIEMVDRGLFPKTSTGPIVEGSPGFCAQFNHIKGGAVLVLSFNHVVADGWSCAEIERLWALHTADASENIPFRRHKTAIPDEEEEQIREQLSTPPVVGGIEKHDGGAEGSLSAMRIIPAEESFTYLQKDLKAFKTYARKAIFGLLKHLVIAGQRLEPRSMAMWSFSKEKLALLKQSASGHGNAEDWISTKDALVGLFWSRMCAIQERKSSYDQEHGSQTLECVLTLNTRKRLHPNVPDSYIGNVLACAIARCSLGELSTDGPEGLRSAAQSLRRANNTWNEARWSRFLTATIDLLPSKALGLSRDMVVNKLNLHYNDWSFFDSNTLNWGENLGLVARARQANLAIPAGMRSLLINPRLPDGGLEVSLGCTQELRRALNADEMFGQFATFVCQGAVPSQWSAKHFAMTALWWSISRLGRLFWWREVRKFKKSAEGR